MAILDKASLPALQQAAVTEIEAMREARRGATIEDTTVVGTIMVTTTPGGRRFFIGLDGHIHYKSRH